jgi:hypothetical protein
MDTKPILIQKTCGNCFWPYEGICANCYGVDGSTELGGSGVPGCENWTALRRAKYRLSHPNTSDFFDVEGNCLHEIQQKVNTEAKARGWSSYIAVPYPLDDTGSAEAQWWISK